MQSLCKVYAEFMQSLCKVYAKFMQSLCRVYAKFMQSLCKVYAEFMQILCSVYAFVMCTITCRGTAVAADKFLRAIPPPFGPIVVVRTTDTTVSFAPISAITGPIFFEPDCSLTLTVRMQPLHKLALHHVRQGGSMTAGDSHKKLVELLVVVTILEVLEM